MTKSAATASTDTGVDLKNDGIPEPPGPQDALGPAEREAEFDALEPAQVGYTPLFQPLPRKVLPPATAVTLVPMIGQLLVWTDAAPATSSPSLLDLPNRPLVMIDDMKRQELTRRRHVDFLRVSSAFCRCRD